MVGVGELALGLGASDPVGRHELKLNRLGASNILDTDGGFLPGLELRDGGFLPIAHLANIETQGWGVCLQEPRLQKARNPVAWRELS